MVRERLDPKPPENPTEIDLEWDLEDSKSLGWMKHPHIEPGTTLTMNVIDDNVDEGEEPLIVAVPVGIVTGYDDETGRVLIWVAPGFQGHGLVNELGIVLTVS